MKLISDVEYDIHGKQTKAYKILRKLNQTEKDDLELNPISENTWLNYYEKLWTTEHNYNFEHLSINNEDVDPITIEELKDVVKNSRNRKAPGPDDINMELIKYAPENFMYRLLNLLNVCWKYGYSPEEWQEAIIIPIFKKGDRRDCGNYRGISLLNTGYKIYSKIITNRLAVITENILLEEQHGFRNNRSCIDCVFSISQMIEKNREYNIPTYIAFIDYNKAFDTVNRQKLWEVLRSKGIPDHLIRVIQGLYSNTKIRIKLKNGISKESKEITRGVRQGCSLSPVLFNLYIDDVTRRWLLHMETIFNRTNTPLNTILFADDQAIFTTTEDDLQRALFKLNWIAKEYDLQISTKKTKVMGFKGTTPLRTKIIINNEIIEQVNCFNYLGCMISYEQINDIDRKLSKFQQLIGTIKRTLKKKVRTDTILKFYKTMAIPTLTYGSETWCMTTQQMKRIEAAEMRLLRPIAGYSLLDHKRNEDIRQELNMPNIIETITEYRNKWHEHICRMEPTRIPYRLHHYKPQGRRRIGRPRKRWKDQF